jgi:hypothetical protein
MTLIPCANENCTTRVDPEHMAGGYCGTCFRRLPPETRRRLIAEQRRAGRAVFSAATPHHPPRPRFSPVLYRFAGERLRSA